jgi:two-component system chemotaxis response regulator CheB
MAREPALEVVGEATNRATTLAMLEELRPNLVTLDLYLRVENGLDLAAAIMQHVATPIVMVTAADVKDPELVFKAMQTGVLEVCAKLPSPTHPDYQTRRTRLLRTLKTLGRVPVVHRTRRANSTTRLSPPEPKRAPPLCDQRAASAAPPWLLIGASTGGPPAAASLLRQLPKPFPYAIGLVQHMAAGFVQGFATWLSKDTKLPAVVLEAAGLPQAGVIYLPPEDHHLIIRPGEVTLSPDKTRGPYRPSVDVLFESAVEAGLARRTTAILLTGMGKDGAAGLLALRAAGARTIAQDPKSCAVSSMPAQAIARDAAELVLTPDAMARVLARRD